ncbi:SRPBCC domain-containing protein [Arthrobacter sp. M4]|uniref:SRPBCC family protein n=1 Tax=Arthrobacter sp. M4 TaxID=218160 RepID=UPI001CDD2D32|nr:SRPBCC family protein [Arthrobacter sp. M4]MCA4134526.1 SRPBCC domain-containing protein [Arthrobacter sp. M4]
MTFSKTVVLPVDPDEAFALITQPERLRRWKAVAARVDLRVGGEYRLTVVPGHSASGTYQEIEPGKRVVYTWGWEEADAGLPPGASTVTVTLEKVDGGTAVTLVHEGLTAEQEASHAEGWEHFLGRLVQAASHGDAGPDEWAAVPDPLNELGSAEAALALTQRALFNVQRVMFHVNPSAEQTVDAQLERLVGALDAVAAPLGVPVSTSETGLGGARAGSPEVTVADLGQAAIESLRARGEAGTVRLGSAELPVTTVATLLAVELLVHAYSATDSAGQALDVPEALSGYVLARGREALSAEAMARAHADEAGNVVGAHPEAGLGAVAENHEEPNAHAAGALLLAESGASLERLAALSSRSAAVGHHSGSQDAANVRGEVHG